MVFNVMARNHDDHVKNISFLMDRKGIWHLSPAYDVTYAYNPAGMWTGSHQMTINGKRDAITRQDLLTAARTMGVRKNEAEHIIADVQKSLMEWKSFAEKAHLSDSVAVRISNQFIYL